MFNYKEMIKLILVVLQYELLWIIKNDIMKLFENGDIFLLYEYF